MAGENDSKMLRDLAAALREKHAAVQAEKMTKVGHLLNAAHGLQLLKRYGSHGK
jgi:hypothetical protein